MAACRPEEVIEQFVKFSQRGGLTRGEEGLVVTMNTRWLPHYVRFRQMLAVDSVRYNFAPTSHDPLAQSRGVFTFHFDSRGDVWQCFGAEETGAKEFSRLVDKTSDSSTEIDAIHKEICQTGIETDQPITLAIQPILAKGSRKGQGPGRFLVGNYKLTLLCVEPTEAVAGDHIFDLRVEAAEQMSSQTYRLPPTQARFLQLRSRGSNKSKWNSIHELKCDGLDRTGPVTASGHYSKYSPKNAIDGDSATRWAIEGAEHWIQFTLDPQRSFDRLEIQWYDGASRQYDFDVRVSDDGKQWEEVPYKQNADPGRLFTQDRIDVCEAVGGANRTLALSYPIELKSPTVLEMTLTPVHGKVRICGAILTPMDRPDASTPE